MFNFWSGMYFQEPHNPAQYMPFVLHLELSVKLLQHKNLYEQSG